MENILPIENKARVCHNCGSLIEPSILEKDPTAIECRSCSVIMCGPDLVDDFDL